MAIKTNKEWVELLDAAIQELITGKVSSTSINGMSYTLNSISDLQKLREYYLTEYIRQHKGISKQVRLRG